MSTFRRNLNRGSLVANAAVLSIVAIVCGGLLLGATRQTHLRLTWCLLGSRSWSELVKPLLTSPKVALEAVLLALALRMAVRRWETAFFAVQTVYMLAV